jgi:hypothetical protein
MPAKFVFADEAGCFTFKRQEGASKYFLLCTLTTEDCRLSADLLGIRRDLSISGDGDRDKLHATSDTQATRNRVFDALEAHDFRIGATLLEKSKAQPQTRTEEHVFYQYAWYFHFKHTYPRIAEGADKLMVTAAALGSKRTRATFKQSFNNTVQQIAPRNKWEVGFLDSANDPMLWAADYCAWAIQRKWERDDDRSHKLISRKIASEFDLWQRGSRHYY